MFCVLDLPHFDIIPRRKQNLQRTIPITSLKLKDIVKGQMLNFIRTLIRCRNPHEQSDKLKFHGRNTIGCSCTIVRVIHFTKILMHVWADPSSESKTQKILPPVALPESCCKSNLPWITSRFSELLSDITEFGREHAMLPGITEFGGEHEERCQHTDFGWKIWIKNKVFF